MELLEAHIEEVGLGQIEKLGNVNAEVIFCRKSFRKSRYVRNYVEKT